MTPEAFRATLANDTPPALPPALVSLWHMEKGDWHAAHDLINESDEPDAMWVHAHLHRVEGDLGNAAYWYRRAGRPVSNEPLEVERAAILEALLAR